MFAEFLPILKLAKTNDIHICFKFPLLLASSIFRRCVSIGMEGWNNPLKTKIKLDCTVYKVQFVPYWEHSVPSLEAPVCKCRIYRKVYFYCKNYVEQTNTSCNSVDKIQRFLRAFAKSRRVIASSCLSVHPHWTTRLPVDGVSWNLTFEYFCENL